MPAEAYHGEIGREATAVPIFVATGAKTFSDRSPCAGPSPRRSEGLRPTLLMKTAATTPSPSLPSPASREETKRRRRYLGVSTVTIWRPSILNRQRVADRRFNLAGPPHRGALHHAVVMRGKLEKRPRRGMRPADIAPVQPEQVDVGD